MKNIFYFFTISVICLLFFSCNQRNTAEVDDTSIPPGEIIFNANWELTEELDGYKVTNLSMSFNNYIIATTSLGNVFRSKYRGEQWTLIPAANNSIATIYRSVKEYMYAGTSHGELYYSDTNGRSWLLLKTFDYGINAFVTANDTSLITGTSEGLYRLENNAETWNSISNGIPSTLKIYSLIILREGTILAGTSDGLYISKDNGISWNSSGFNEACYNFSQSFNGILFAGTQNGIFRSDNNGESWVQAGLANERIISLTVSKEKNLFAGTNNKGIYYSNNNGNTWIKFGLDNKAITTILYEQSSNMVFAGGDNKVYRLAPFQ